MDILPWKYVGKLSIEELTSGIEWIQDKFILDHLNVQQLILMLSSLSLDVCLVSYRLPCRKTFTVFFNFFHSPQSSLSNIGEMS